MHTNKLNHFCHQSTQDDKSIDPMIVIKLLGDEIIHLFRTQSYLAQGHTWFRCTHKTDVKEVEALLKICLSVQDNNNSFRGVCVVTSSFSLISLFSEF